MSKTAILDFTIKSDSTEQFSVAYSEFDIDGNEKETLTLKESNAGTEASMEVTENNKVSSGTYRLITSNGQKLSSYPTMENRLSTL